MTPPTNTALTLATVAVARCAGLERSVTAVPGHDETPDPRTVVIIGGVVYDGEEGL